jgi:hypothetical protein
MPKIVQWRNDSYSNQNTRPLITEMPSDFRWESQAHLWRFVDSRRTSVGFTRILRLVAESCIFPFCLIELSACRPASLPNREVQVKSLMLELLFKTLETVTVDTPNAWAMSFIRVAIRLYAPVPPIISLRLVRLESRFQRQIHHVPVEQIGAAVLMRYGHRLSDFARR